MPRLEQTSRFPAEVEAATRQRYNLKNFKPVCVVLFLIHSLCVSVMTQTRITPEPPVGKGVVVLKAARLIDGTGAAPINNAVVVVTDNTITAVGAAGAVCIPANAKMIDLGDVTLLPGFIDAHTHLIGRVLGDPESDNAGVRDFESFAAILSVAHARATMILYLHPRTLSDKHWPRTRRRS